MKIVSKENFNYKRGKTVKAIKQLSAISVVALALSGCMATQTALNNQSLDVQTHMTKTVFLDPVPDSQKTVYVQTRNTSDQQNLEVKPYIVRDLQQNGYRVVSNLNQAHYVLQVNVTKAGEFKPDKAAMAVDGTISGAAVGAAAGSLGNSNKDIAAGALAGVVIGNLANAMFKDVRYELETEVQISERSSVNQHVTQTAKIRQGTSTVQTIKSESNGQWTKYQTKVISSAEKMNLKFEQASPYLAQDLAKTIANLFA